MFTGPEHRNPSILSHMEGSRGGGEEARGGGCNGNGGGDGGAGSARDVLPEGQFYLQEGTRMPICAHRAALLRAVALLLALSSSMAAATDSSAARSSLLKGQNLRRIRRPRIDEGEAVLRPVRPVGDHTLFDCVLLRSGSFRVVRKRLPQQTV
jgi:hypothetical protein